MPHNSYQPFDVSLLKHYFKDIKMSSIKIRIKKSLKEYKILINIYVRI